MLIGLFALLVCFANTGCGEIAADTAEEAPPSAEIKPSKGENCFALFKADADGHTWENAYLLALACHYNYPEQLDVSPAKDVPQFEKRYKEKIEPWGIDTFEFVYGAGRAFDTELVVISRSDSDFVVVVFRGSEHFLKDPVSGFKDGILTDANCALSDVSEHLGEGVNVHTGFWNAFFPVRDAVAEAIERQGGFSPDKKLWITGNSLGAALANICTLWLREEGHNVRGVYTYGAPLCGNDRFRERYEDEFSIMCQRWVNGNDLVPMLPPVKVFPEYRHVGTLNKITNDGSIELNSKESKGLGNPFRHYQEFYCYRIYEALPKEIKTEMPPPPPLPAVVRPFL